MVRYGYDKAPNYPHTEFNTGVDVILNNESLKSTSLPQLLVKVN